MFPPPSPLWPNQPAGLQVLLPVLNWGGGGLNKNTFKKDNRDFLSTQTISSLSVFTCVFMVIVNCTGVWGILVFSILISI